MKEIVIKIRNQVIRFFYISIVKPILFLFDPEKVHDVFVKIGKILGSNLFTKSLTSLFFGYSNKILKQNILGIKFENPVGLAAGFDKNAEMIGIAPSVGFGHTEVGSITGEPCEGNPKPRLWRLKKSKGLVVYYGLKNNGCEKIAKRLKNKKFHLPVGISIAKTNSPETITLKSGIKDYLKAYDHLKEIGDYLVVNISCPNVHGGQPFTSPEYLEKLLSEIESKTNSKKPLFLKIAPDLSEENLEQIIEISIQHKIDGFICANLTKDRENPLIKGKILDDNDDNNDSKKGGISGKVVEELANKTIKHVYEKIGGKAVIIGCGGIFTAEDAYKKIRLGASLVQLITGMIYEGPQAISEINRGLADLLKKDGFKNISEAIGVDVK